MHVGLDTDNQLQITSLGRSCYELIIRIIQHKAPQSR